MPSVLSNLLERYQKNQIYTNSGLFLIAINPYQSFNSLYDDAMIEKYQNFENQENEPHIFDIVGKAYKSMKEDFKNQSILITGESGAGKTESTKRAIQFLVHQSLKAKGKFIQIFMIDGDSKEFYSHLEEQILATNPILEAFGNAQTVRNNNSSRFGKFVRIEFDKGGKIHGARIERYLLEKSRVIHRSQGERSFHIFYQITSKLDDFEYLKGSSKKDSDTVGFENLINSFETLGFSKQEQDNIFDIVKSILHLGNLEFVQSSNDQATLHPKSEKELEKICEFLRVPKEEFLSALLNPILKAGKEIISQSRDVAQVKYSVDALARNLYEKLFTYLIDRINLALDKNGEKKGQNLFIGVLDIAGFEIFERNSFEQLCVNYTNEKLQQLFNHCMLIKEQEEYKREGLTWDMVDYGADLQPTIDLIEKCNPVGILACLDEDCVVPKATDHSFTQKINTLWGKKNSKFESDKFGDGFSVYHYAGKVDYNTQGWLDKNKDPMNESVVRVLSASLNDIVHDAFSERPTHHQSNIVKKGVFRTVAQRHKESLTILMHQLSETQPHFIRCIIPNEYKAPNNPNPLLILQQLRCNGVLEGIRICRQGFPTRILHKKFVNQYRSLVNSVKSDIDEFLIKEIMKSVGICDYQIGNSLFLLFHRK
jgi:myosin heavy chain 9/10/11/14